MKLVLDSNILFSALIKKSTARNIILSDIFDLYAPEYIFSELAKHRELVIKKSKLNEGEFNALLIILQKHVHLVSKEKYKEMITLAEETLREVDITDSPFLALALTLKCSVWSNDTHFKRQNKVRAYTTRELIKTIT